MMPQFSYLRNKIVNYKHIASALFIFSIGLFKKVVLADTFALWATGGFDQATSLNFVEAWTTSLSYSLQLYFDFSGYTDMAIGAALLFNIRLPVNFNSPYKALNIQEFWRRWHITLSRFLRDYIYIPLGGNRKGDYRTYSNLIITFLIGGLWHGAGWTFVFWGFLHGAALVVNRAWQALGIRVHGIIAWFITFNFVNVTWVFFRAEEWSDAVKVLKGMFGLNGFGPVASGLGLYTAADNIDTALFILLGLTALPGVFLLRNSMEMTHAYRPTRYYQFLTLLIACVGVLHLNRVTEFLYFNF